jgi:6-phosphogluconolactonase
VTVTLVDERMVPAPIRALEPPAGEPHLLQNRAAEAGFVPLYNSKGDADGSGQAASAAIVCRLALPLRRGGAGNGNGRAHGLVLPGRDDADAATDPACRQSVMPIEAPGAGEPRLTLTLPRIVEAGLLALHIEGEQKRPCSPRRFGAGRKPRCRCARCCGTTKTPVEIYWAP